jgi:hypothetical protein
MMIAAMQTVMSMNLSLFCLGSMASLALRARIGGYGGGRGMAEGNVEDGWAK